MGWNKQSGDAWVLQRTIDGKIGEDTSKALALRVTGLLTIDDAEKLAQALVDEIWAAKRSEGKQPETREQWKARTFALHYGAEQDLASAVLKNWDETLGVELYPWQRKLVEHMVATSATTVPICRKCGTEIRMDQTAFGSKESGWEHMEGECAVVDERIDYAPQFDDDDGCPND